jgi:hypothetical protein
LVYAVFCLAFDGVTFDDMINPSSHFITAYSNSWISGINPSVVCANAIVQLYECSGMIGWTVILLPFLIIWYRQRLKTFSPYNIEEPISYEEAKEAVK